MGRGREEGVEGGYIHRAPALASLAVCPFSCLPKTKPFHRPVIKCKLDFHTHDFTDMCTNCAHVGSSSVHYNVIRI